MEAMTYAKIVSSKKLKCQAEGNRPLKRAGILQRRGQSRLKHFGHRKGN